MATVKLIRSYDSAKLTLGGPAENTTVYVYTVNDSLGPFELVVDRSTTPGEARAQMQQRADELTA